jgi:hypothetical protein
MGGGVAGFHGWGLKGEFFLFSCSIDFLYDHNVLLTFQYMTFLNRFLLSY